MHTLPSLDLSPRDHLDLIRRLDREHAWSSLGDERYCTQCHEVFSARDLDIIGGTRALGPLRLQCPTAGCRAAPGEWLPVRDRRAARGNIAKPGLVRARRSRARNERRTRSETLAVRFRKIAARLNMLPMPLQGGGIPCDPAS